MTSPSASLPTLAAVALLGLTLAASPAAAQRAGTPIPGRAGVHPGPGVVVPGARPGVIVPPRGGWHPGPGWRHRPAGWGYGWGPGWGPGWGVGVYSWGFGPPWAWTGSYPTFSEVDDMPCLKKVWLSKTRWTWRRLC